MKQQFYLSTNRSRDWVNCTIINHQPVSLGYSPCLQTSENMQLITRLSLSISYPKFYKIVSHFTLYSVLQSIILSGDLLSFHHLVLFQQKFYFKLFPISNPKHLLVVECNNNLSKIHYFQLDPCPSSPTSSYYHLFLMTTFHVIFGEFNMQVIRIVLATSVKIIYSRLMSYMEV